MSLLAMFHSADRSKSLSSQDMIAVLHKNPGAAAEVDPLTGNTALHFAACNGARAPNAPLSKCTEFRSVTLIDALLKAYPDAASMEDLGGNLPLAGAVANGGSLEVVQALLAAYPQGARSRSGVHTMLHSAACNHQTPEVVQSILDAWPEAAKEVDTDGNTPLHFAAACQAHPRSTATLIAAYPQAARMRGMWARLPLSLALLCEAPPLAVAAIRDANPGALRDHSIVADYGNHGMSSELFKMDEEKEMA